MEKNLEKIVLAGGCFWCTEAVFQRIDGVESVTPGFAGGNIKNPPYREVVTGRTGHAEAVEILFNAETVSVENLLEIFFATHDPTTLNRQGNDVGAHYRSAIFYTTDVQKETSEKFIKLLEEEKIFKNPIVTEIKPLEAFYKAEEEHLNYYNDNQYQPYCQFVINPKIKKLKQYFSDKLKTE